MKVHTYKDDVLAFRLIKKLFNKNTTFDYQYIACVGHIIREFNEFDKRKIK